MGQGKKSETYKPIYPTTVGAFSHDITFAKLPAYSMSAKPVIKTKFNSPGPGAYPINEGKSKKHIPKSLYPEDKAYKYSIGIKGREPAKFQTPSPATYPLSKDAKDGGIRTKTEVISIYPKDNANKFSIAGRREQKYFTPSPGPAVYPRDANTENINSLFPTDKANKFTMRPRQVVRNMTISPGPAKYPCTKKEMKNKVATIYPTETQLLPTMKGRYDIKNKQNNPAPNTYPMEYDVSKKTMIPGKNSPKYSIGIKHSPKQHILILKSDEF